MLDINLIREQPELIRESLRKRQMDAAVVDQVLELDQERRAVIQDVENLKAERNVVSKQIGRIKDPDERQTKIEAMRTVGDEIDALDGKLKKVEEKRSRAQSCSGVSSQTAQKASGVKAHTVHSSERCCKRVPQG